MKKQSDVSKTLAALIDAGRTQLTLLGQLAEALEPKGPSMVTSILEETKPLPGISLIEPKKKGKKTGLTLPNGFKLSPYKTSRKNTPVYVLTGDTKPIKDQLKALGCKWVRAKTGWTVLDTEIAAVRKIIG